jgi:hypothetical protein
MEMPLLPQELAQTQFATGIASDDVAHIDVLATVESRKVISECRLHGSAVVRRVAVGLVHL